MKKIKLIILLLFTSIICNAQYLPEVIQTFQKVKISKISLDKNDKVILEGNEVMESFTKIDIYKQDNQYSIILNNNVFTEGKDRFFKILNFKKNQIKDDIIQYTINVEDYFDNDNTSLQKFNVFYLEKANKLELIYVQYLQHDFMLTFFK